METRDAKKYSLGQTTIFICPACGVVNPAGPSGGCPHLQVVRFEGVDERLEDLISEVATARRAYAEKTDTLKRIVMSHVQEGTASVETPHRITASEVDKLYSKAGKTPFTLTHPGAENSPKGTAPRKHRPTPRRTEKMNARQLDLLAYSAPKGDA